MTAQQSPTLAREDKIVEAIDNIQNLEHVVDGIKEGRFHSQSQSWGKDIKMATDYCAVLSAEAQKAEDKKTIENLEAASRLFNMACSGTFNNRSTVFSQSVESDIKSVKKLCTKQTEKLKM